MREILGEAKTRGRNGDGCSAGTIRITKSANTIETELDRGDLRGIALGWTVAVLITDISNLF